MHAHSSALHAPSVLAGIYVHIPFCKQRCIYCDFYFVTSKRAHDAFVQSLCAEIEHYGSSHGMREPVETIYVGGGTPSLLTAGSVERVLAKLAEHFDTGDVREVAIEVNPDDVNAMYLRTLRNLGVTRLSIGIQSFFADDLRWMNRAHTAEDAEQAIRLAQDAGFDNLSADLIFGLPEQPMSRWARNLERVASLDVPHVATYSLTIEARTPLYKQVQLERVNPATDTVLADRYRFAMDFLRGEGYAHYEVSSFSKPGYEAVHNQLYWRHANYLGFGPSAHSFWMEDGGSAYRWANVRSLKKYIDLPTRRSVSLEFHEELTAEQLADEYMFLRLRTREGLHLDALASYGVDLKRSSCNTLDQLQQEGYIEPWEGNVVRLTDKGVLVCDAITQQLLSR